MKFLKTLWHEVEPIFSHGIVAASVAVIAAGLLKLFEFILPPEYATELHIIDYILVVASLWLFGGYTLAILLIRLGKHIQAEFRKTNLKQRGTARSKVSSKESFLLPEGQDHLVEEFKQDLPRKKAASSKERGE